MPHKYENNAINKYMRAVLGVFLSGVIFFPQAPSAATLDQWIAEAKREGALNGTVTAAMTGRSTPRLAAAFKARFGLDIDVTLTAVSDLADTPRAIAETKAGVVPTYDAAEGSDITKFTLIQKAVRQLIQQSGAKIVDFLSTQKGRDSLDWYGTDEGRKYQASMGKAIRGE